ncbi:hypothetical protein [Chitinimonas sp.]|uniref:MMPL family transporter n=1 Tax=Chitinimonas sp. TaxID=1934313 RepID=UPI002F91DF8A
MTEVGRASRPVRWLAMGWLVLVLAVLAHNLYLWTGNRMQLDTDVLAMLPRDEREPAVQQATQRLADAAGRRIVVLVAGRDWSESRRAADAYAASLEASDLKLALRYRVADDAGEQWLGFFAPYRQHLLTDGQRLQLQTQAPAKLAEQAVQALYRPMGLPRVGRWQDDPLNLYGGWLTERAGASPVRVADGRLSVAQGNTQYALLTLEQQGPAFSVASQRALVPRLKAARQAALAAVPRARVLTVGVPLFAVAAADQAEHEIHTIGMGSLAGIVLITLFAFSAIRPRILVTLSIAVGLLAAISVCTLLFGHLHLITLVFGASLVGVAENYGTNYFSSRLGRPASERWAMLQEQGRVMWLAMLTTAIGYALLALTPFPGLRQIALFSVVGLSAAFVTVLWWFPFLDKGEMPATRFSRWLGSRRAIWPSLGRNRFSVAFALVVCVLLVLGLPRLTANDDIRLLQNPPGQLLADQIQVGRLLDLPSPAQFYLVRGATAEAVLQAEETLKARLMPLQAAGVIRGVQAVSDWVPSAQRQAADAVLVQRVVQGEAGVLALATRQLGEDMPPASSQAVPLLQLNDWLAAPVSEPLRPQWLGRFGEGYASVVLLRGVDKLGDLPKLAAAGTAVPGVRWVDKVGEISELMARYRYRMGYLVLVSYLLVFGALWRRFGRQSWRALLPTALASGLTLALLALLNQPLQLFNVLALLLILGMGVDYGIFLLAQPERTAVRPFLSITLAAVSTLLAFGLLALSATPALRAFGLTMLFGIGLAWLFTPLFMPLSKPED